jgi:hypothetical protein
VLYAVPATEWSGSLIIDLLFRKMRKPDGVENKNSGKLAIPSSTSKSRTPSRQRSQSTDTPTPTSQSGIPAPDFGTSPPYGDTGAAPTGLMRLQEKLARKESGGERPELVQAAVRRKSVLPKSGRGDDLGAVSAKVESTVARVASKSMYASGVAQTTKEVCLSNAIELDASQRLRLFLIGRDYRESSGFTGRFESFGGGNDFVSPSPRTAIHQRAARQRSPRDPKGRISSDKVNFRPHGDSDNNRRNGRHSTEGKAWQATVKSIPPDGCMSEECEYIRHRRKLCDSSSRRVLLKHDAIL